MVAAPLLWPPSGKKLLLTLLLRILLLIIGGHIYIYVCLSGLRLTPLPKDFFNKTTMLYISLGLDTSQVYSRAAVSEHITFYYD